ncbi:ammonium transporter [Niveispirillum irakense]|uniref:ammonium transporter n=1 Tax=Niveispirillum irakense TaxID=34011 RepID=UPI0013764F78|nr:ammonium transporter [Niveispirillum irakense]
MTNDPIAHIWILSAAGLVFVMQLGFCLLEIGFVRAKNSINVAIKNVMDFCIAGFLFWLFGYALMFGPSVAALVGVGPVMPGADLPSQQLVFLLFQMMFCGTATTIVSGAVAERMGYGAYIMVSALLSALIYPIFGHWAWGGLAGPESQGWLAALGFLDFAGSTVVHSVGGWLALAAVLVIGPRTGRFDAGVNTLGNGNLTMASAGVLVLWFGWLGFNGGSVLGDLERAPGVLLNTMLAGCAGGLAGHFASSLLMRKPAVEHFLNGILGGLVAVTAGALYVGAGAAALIGAIGGVLVIAGGRLLERLRVDDAVGAVPVHLFAGIWGTLAVALFGDVALFGTGLGRWEQLQVQALGVVACGTFTFGAGYGLLRLLNMLVPLRIDVEAERLGLNIAEHGATSPMLDLAAEMERHRSEGKFDRPVHVEPQSDVELIAAQYNRVISKVQTEIQRHELLLEELGKAKVEAENSNTAKSQFLATMSHELRTPLNAVIGFSHLIADQAYGPIDERYVEHAQDINDGGKHLLALVNDVLDFSRLEAGKFQLNEQPVDLRRVMVGVHRLMLPLAEEGALGLTLDMPEALPPLLADERAVRQILINLVGNAVKFTPAGAHVRIQARLEPDWRLCITVADQGIGMDPQQVPKALEPFTQLEGGLAKGHGGSGLGLSLVNALVRLHEGTMVIQTAPGRGTTIHIRFPARRTIEMPARSGAGRPLASSPANAARG